MLLHPYELSPLQYYYYVFYSSFAPPVQNLQQFDENKLNIKEEHQPSCPPNERILLTREDLIAEGYKPSKKPWTQEEDQLLLQLCKDENARFQDIASQINGRNSKMCYSRYRRLIYQSKNNWSKEENQKIRMLVEQYGENQWKHISTFFKERTHKQLKDHYQNYLKPNLNHCDWSVDQDMELIRLLNIHGKNWKAIELGFPNRSKNQIKNRYFGKISRLNNKKLKFEESVMESRQLQKEKIE